MLRDLAAIADKGDYLKTLTALRQRVAEQLDATDSARDVASLSQRMLDVTAAIEVAKKARPGQKGTPLDELAKRRAGAESSPRAPRAAGDSE